MMATPVALIPADEALRLQTLQSYQVLSIPPDPVFHDLVALAALAYNVPVAFLAVVDAH